MAKDRADEVPSSRDLTDYLKGLAITTVFAGHFASRFMSLPFDFYANYFIAFFFVLSGFGMYYSTAPLREKFSALNVGRFLWKRCKRIYPIFWAYIIIDAIVDPGASLSDHSIADLLLLKFNDPPNLWFLNAIVACYVFAPLAVLLMRKTDRLFVPILVVAAIFLHVALQYLEVPPMRCWMYQFIYLGQFLLFGVGMYLATVYKKLTFKANGWYIFLLFVILTATCVHIRDLQILATAESRQQVLPSAWHIIFPVFFYGLTIAITLLFLRFSGRPPLMKLFGVLGVNSFPIYIFEGMYGSGLAKFGLISGHTNMNGLVYLMIFPLFLLYCQAMQKIFYTPLLKQTISRWLKA